MKYILFLGLAITTLFSCDPDTALRKELDTAVFKIDMLEQQLKSNSTSVKGELVHLVYLNTKNDLTENQYAKLIEDLNQLQGISSLKSFSLGGFKSLGDERALSDFEIIMSMSFQNEEAYQKYQTHPTHIALKEKLKDYIDGPPATYDYIQK